MHHGSPNRRFHYLIHVPFIGNYIYQKRRLGLPCVYINKKTLLYHVYTAFMNIVFVIGISEVETHDFQGHGWKNSYPSEKCFVVTPNVE